MTIQQLLNLATQKLSQSKSTSPLLDAEVLLSHLLDQPKEYLFTHADQILSPKLEREFKIRLNRRIKGWPVAYINNKKEFFGLSLFVNKNVLIPRPETEGLVELVLDKAKSQKNIKILDIGTGSGAIIISLAKILGISGNKFFASDISKKALAVAQKNAKQNSVSVTFKQGSLLKPWKNKHFDIIVANLPYLAQQTDPSTKFEPKPALIAKNKGLALYQELFQKLSYLPSPPSSIFLELGHDQAKPIKKLAANFLPAYEIKISKDLAGRTRYAYLAKR